MSVLAVINARFLTQKLTGVQRFAYEISIRLKENFGDRIVFVSPSTGILDKTKADMLDALQVGKLSGYLWEQVELPLWLKQHNTPPLLSLCSVAPLLYSNNYIAVHDITWVRYPKTYNWKFRTAYNIMIPMLCKKAKRIITVSEFSQKEISCNYNIPQEKFIVVYNATGDNFKPLQDPSLKEKRYFLAVSSVKENKNFITVLKAFELLQKVINNIRLYVIGDINDKNFSNIDISKYISNPSISFLGRVTDEELIRYYSNAIGFVFPSLYEGFGIPAIEAQACGCPVISSNASSLPEVLNDSCVFFSPKDMEDLAVKMKKFTYNNLLREELVRKGYENVKRFSWENSARIISEILKINEK
jgi:glycosyltransferase involved in cell wall biosynthesis